MEDAWACVVELAIFELALPAIGDGGLAGDVVEVCSARAGVCVTEAPDVDAVAAGTEVVAAVDAAVATLELC